MPRLLAQGVPESSGLREVSGTTADAAPALRAYLSTVTGSVTLSGDYFLDSAVEVPAAVTQLQLTAGTRLKVRGDHSALTRTGTIVYREQLQTAMAKGKTAITVVKPANYRVNEYLLLAGDDSLAGGTERYGYLRRVTSISGTTVQLDKALPRVIQLKPRTASVVLAPSLKLSGAGEIFHTDPSSSVSPLVRYFAVDNPQVSGITVHDNGAAGIYVGHCKGGLIDCTIRDLLDDEATEHFGYGVNVTGSTRGLTVRGTISRVRHAVTTNVGPFISVMSAAGEPEDCVFEPVAIDCSDKSVDTHRVGWNTTIVPHITGGRGGVQVRADNTHVVGGTITGCTGPGISINPLVTVAPTIDATVISYLKPSGTALLADAPVVATNLDIRDSYGVHIVLASGSIVSGASINAGGAVGVQFRGSNNTVSDIRLGSNVTTPYTESSGSTNNTFTLSGQKPALLAAPQATTSPTVSGDFRVGEQLSVDDGTWNQGPLTYYFTWLRNGVPVSNATNRTYRTYDVVSADLGARLVVRVVAKRAGYEDGTADTAETVPIGAGEALVPTVKPVLSGTPKAGQTLSVTRGTWDAAAQATKTAWYANGTANGTTGTTYLVKKSDLGKKLTVTVTATRTGFVDGSFTPPGLTVVA